MKHLSLFLFFFAGLSHFALAVESSKTKQIDFNNATASEDQSALEKLPSNVFVHLANYLNPQDLRQLPEVSKKTYQQVKEAKPYLVQSIQLSEDQWVYYDETIDWVLSKTNEILQNESLSNEEKIEHMTAFYKDYLDRTKLLDKISLPKCNRERLASFELWVSYLCTGIRSQLFYHIMPQLNATVAWDTVMEPIKPQIDNQLGSQILTQIRALVSPQISDHISDLARAQIREEVWDKVHPQVTKYSEQENLLLKTQNGELSDEMKPLIHKIFIDYLLTSIVKFTLGDFEKTRMKLLSNYNHKNLTEAQIIEKLESISIPIDHQEDASKPIRANFLNLLRLFLLDGNADKNPVGE